MFATGLVYHHDDESQTYIAGATTMTDCIPSVKTTGSYRQYMGICTAIHESPYTALLGDVMKVEVTINQPTIDFATHEDFLFRVNDSSQ